MAATSLGLTDLVRSTDAGDINPLELVIIMALASAAIVVMWLALEFALRARRWPQRFACLAVYVFCMLWSVGFGFGFYWKHLASVDQARAELQTENETVLGPLRSASRSLEGVTARIKKVSDTSEHQKNTEDTDGGSCDNARSGSGRGDFYVARTTLANKVSTLTGDLSAWIDGGGGTSLTDQLSRVTKEVQELGGSAADTANANPQTLKTDFERVEADTSDVIARINGVIKGKDQYISRLIELSKFAGDGVPTRSGPCKDSGLADTLKTAATTLEKLREIPPPPFHVRLGAEATKDAFYRIWRNMGAMLLALVPGIAHPDLSARDRLGEGDMVALVAAVVVDIGIAFLTVMGGGRDVLTHVEDVFAPRSRDTRLRRELSRFAQDNPDALRRVLRLCTVDHAQRSYLIASEEIPELYVAIRNMQNVLVASKDGRVVGLSDPTFLERLTRRPSKLPERIRRHLMDVAADLWMESHSVRSRPPVPRNFFDHRISVVRIRREMVFHLERLLSTLAQPGAAVETVQGAPPTPDALVPNPPPPGPHAPRGDLETVLQGWLAGAQEPPAARRPSPRRSPAPPATIEPLEPGAEVRPTAEAPLAREAVDASGAPDVSESPQPPRRRSPRRARPQDTEGM